MARSSKVERDKPKDAYDICYCLERAPGGVEALARSWMARLSDRLVAAGLSHLRDKFATVASFGPSQVALFHDASSTEEREMLARRAYELVARFLERSDPGR